MNPKTTPAELRDTLNSNLEEVDKLEALINNLLRLSQLEADELKQNFRTIPLQNITDRAVSQISQQADERKVQITNNTTDALVEGDENSLVQLLVILLDNAVKYSPPKGSVSVHSTVKDNQVMIKIKDEGEGIAKDDLDHVFDRFYRSDSSRNKSTQTGYGLGLSIAQMIADVHNAEITLQSRVKHGTTAAVTLPRAKDEPRTTNN